MRQHESMDMCLDQRVWQRVSRLLISMRCRDSGEHDAKESKERKRARKGRKWKKEKKRKGKERK